MPEIKFQKMRDQTPAIVITHEFSKRFEKACEVKFGEILPNEKSLLLPVALSVLVGMGAPLTPLRVETHSHIQNEREKQLAFEREDKMRSVIETALLPVFQWFVDYEPSCEESFLQSDSVNEALPELGEACMKMLATLREAGIKTP